MHASIKANTGRLHPNIPDMRRTAYMHNSQWALSIAFVSRMKTFVFSFVVFPFARSSCPRSHEHLRFWHDGADTRGEERDPRRRPEQRAPGLRDMWDEPQVDHGGDQIAHRVALLEDARSPPHALRRAGSRARWRRRAPICRPWRYRRASERRGTGERSARIQSRVGERSRARGSRLEAICVRNGQK